MLCFCLIGCQADSDSAGDPDEGNIYDMSLDELRKERARLREETRDIRDMYLLGGDDRRGLLIEIAVLRAILEVHGHVGALPMPKEAPVKPVLALPRDPLQVTIVQRRTKAIPGSDETVTLRVGDITGGQVLVEIAPVDGPPLLDMVSMKPGDLAKFQVGDKTYHLTLAKLQNFLFGDDLAVFEVSTRPPSADRLRALHKAAQPPEDHKTTQPGAVPETSPR